MTESERSLMQMAEALHTQIAHMAAAWRDGEVNANAFYRADNAYEVARVVLVNADKETK